MISISWTTLRLPDPTLSSHGSKPVLPLMVGLASSQDLPSFLTSRFLHTASNQKLEVRKALGARLGRLAVSPYTASLVLWTNSIAIPNQLFPLDTPLHKMQAQMFCIAVYMVCRVPNSIDERNSHIPPRQACLALWMCDSKLANHVLEQQQIFRGIGTFHWRV